MTDDQAYRRNGKASLLARALGVDALASDLARQVRKASAELDAQLTAQGRDLAAAVEAAEARLNRSHAQTLAEVHTMVSAVNARLDRSQADTLAEIHQMLSAIDARLDRNQADALAEAHRMLSAIDDHLSQTISGSDGHLSAGLQGLAEQFTRHAAAQALHVGEAAFESRRLQNAHFSRDSAISSTSVKQYYLQLRACTAPCDFDEVGLGVFSQNNEDGILLYIFSKIGMAGKRCIEIGCDLSASTVGVPEGNTINLITNFAFHGLIVDMDADKVAGLRHFFAQALSTRHLHAPAHDGLPAGYFSPLVVQREVTEANVNALFEEAGFVGDIDLLSIDVDGLDVSIWGAVEVVSPRVVVIEINARIPFEDVVVGGPQTSKAPPESLEYQAARSSSLAAACEVGLRKGYLFIGMDATLLNAFFLRNDVWSEAFAKRAPSDYTNHRMNPLLRRPRSI